MRYDNLQEEELKARIGDAFFSAFDCDTIIGKIDFCVTQKPFTLRNATKTETAPIVSLLWAEAKRGTVTDIYRPLVQLILTIGKARTFDTYLPPPFLAAFDAEKIAFLPYREILPFLALNDFNWNITPSDTSSREFGLLYAAVRDVLDRTAYLFRYDAHEKELREFIKQELKVSSKPLPLIKNHRVRKGSFFTPKIWVDLSQKYLADVLGENWQDEYYVWDCAAGTGNLLNGLTNKYNIWASTLDQQDVDVMKDRIKNGANLLENHVFQFDFLNDEFDCGKLPTDLLAILKDPKKRKKLVIYINPPYAEAGNARTRTGERNKSKVSNNTRICEQFRLQLGLGIRELFAQFLMRIATELPEVHVGIFSKLKYLQGTAFRAFRQYFLATPRSGFVVPANTFDNVKGEFPISFIVWDLSHPVPFREMHLAVYTAAHESVSTKRICALENILRITDWIAPFRTSASPIGYTGNFGPDFQSNKTLYIVNSPILNSNGSWSNATKYALGADTLIPLCLYFAIRFCIVADWLNDRDQFLYPKDGWETDAEFQTNCLAFTLFHTQNRITAKDGSNHFIPFTEQEVNAQSRFESHFMTDFMAGKLFHPLTHQSKTTLQALAEEKSFIPSEPLVFSAEATAVFDAGRELWRYYHSQPRANPNASYYDIRVHFQGRNDKGKMNAKSIDETYNLLLSNLKEAMEQLRLQIVPKVYEYGFLIF